LVAEVESLLWKLKSDDRILEAAKNEGLNGKCKAVIITRWAACGTYKSPYLQGKKHYCS